MLREQVQYVRFQNTNNITFAVSAGGVYSSNQSNAQFLLSSGVYDVDRSFVEVQYSGMTNHPVDATGYTIYARKDFCPNVIGCVGTAQIDGIQRFLSNSLAQTQLAYYLHEYSNSNDKDMAITNATHQSRTFFNQIGYAPPNAGIAGQVLSQFYPVDQFLPGMFLKGQKFQIRSQGNIQFTANKWISFGFEDRATGKNNLLVAPQADGANIQQHPTTVCFIFHMALIPNQPFVDEKYLSVYDSVQFNASQSAPHNRSFGPNELCYKQLYSIVDSQAATLAIHLGQDSANLNLQIDRDGYKLVNATGINQLLACTSQFSKTKTDHRTINFITEDKYQNCTVQQNISSLTVAASCIHLGYFILLQIA